MKPYYETELGALYLGDAKEVVSSLPYCDLVFTSPPYDKQRDYENPIEDWTELLAETFLNIRANSDTQIVINFGVVYKNYEFVFYWDEFLEYLKADGWRLYGLYIWDQLEGLPGHFFGRFSKSFEFLFHFNKKRIDIKKTKLCTTKGRKHFPDSGGLLLKDGTRRKVRKFHKTGKYKIPRDVIGVPRHKGNRTGHPATFPIGLPSEIILAMTEAFQIVLDPFMGSGTTALACEYLNRQWLGVEISEKYCEMTATALEKQAKQKLKACL